MDDRFDQEFYRSEWHRTLPLGPHGIQPYVRTSHSSRLPDLGRLVAIVGTMAQVQSRSGAGRRSACPGGCCLRRLNLERRGSIPRSAQCTKRRTRLGDERRQRDACPGRPSSRTMAARRAGFGRKN